MSARSDTRGDEEDPRRFYWLKIVIGMFAVYVLYRLIAMIYAFVNSA